MFKNFVSFSTFFFWKLAYLNTIHMVCEVANVGSELSFLKRQVPEV